MAQFPMAMTHLGSGIWSYNVLTAGSIFLVMVPATIITSDCRGEGRNTSAPNRDISNLDPPVLIISMAQQASPKVIGQSELARQRLSSLSSCANWTTDDGTFSVPTWRLLSPRHKRWPTTKCRQIWESRQNRGQQIPDCYRQQPPETKIEYLHQRPEI